MTGEGDEEGEGERRKCQKNRREVGEDQGHDGGVTERDWS